MPDNQHARPHPNNDARIVEPSPDAPITGVAGGGLGTATNLDDTQVMRTEDLRAAAAAATGRPIEPPAAPVQATDVPAPTSRRTPKVSSGRNAPVLAGVIAVVVLLGIAGSGLLSQLDFGTASGPGGSFAFATDAAPSSTAPPQLDGKGAGGAGGSGHGPKGCHGHGHGSGCEGAED